MTTAGFPRATLPAVLGLLTLGAGAGVQAQALTGGDFIHARVTMDDGTSHEGRLRFGGDEEALWGNYFNGVKQDNPWAVYLPGGRLREPQAVEFLGIPFGTWQRTVDLSRPFMVRIGDIARIDAPDSELRITLKSGTIVELDRYSADDFADGIRVWNANGSVVDLDEWAVDSIEFLPAAANERAGEPLRGTVRTRNGEFTGLIQWDREQCLPDDNLEGISAGEAVSFPFSAIRSIERQSGEGIFVRLVDGREVALSDTAEARTGNRGIYVDDLRYGRVLVRWAAFERVDFFAGGAGPAYGDFPAGSPLTGTVSMRSGARAEGRLVFDLDESQTTDTLDAPWRDVDYTIPFGLVASIEPGETENEGTGVTRIELHGGEALALEAAGDLDRRNAGMLIFAGADQAPQYVPWSEIARIDLDRPAAMLPSQDR